MVWYGMVWYGGVATGMGAKSTVRDGRPARDGGTLIFIDPIVGSAVPLILILSRDDFFPPILL
jgi:hypothetical protein